MKTLKTVLKKYNSRIYEKRLVRTMDKDIRVKQLIEHLDKIRHEYNRELSILRDKYYPEIKDTLNKINDLMN